MKLGIDITLCHIGVKRAQQGTEPRGAERHSPGKRVKDTLQSSWKNRSQDTFILVQNILKIHALVFHNG